MNQKRIDKKLDEIHVYMDWFITMLCLNGCIDKTKVSTHPIHLNTAEEMSRDHVDTKIYHDYQDGLSKLNYWRKIHRIKKLKFKK